MLLMQAAGLENNERIRAFGKQLGEPCPLCLVTALSYVMRLVYYRLAYTPSLSFCLYYGFQPIISFGSHFLNAFLFCENVIIFTLRYFLYRFSSGKIGKPFKGPEKQKTPQPL